MEVKCIHHTDTKMDYESASHRRLSTSPNLVLCYVRMLSASLWITDGVYGPGIQSGFLKNGA